MPVPIPPEFLPSMVTNCLNHKREYVDLGRLLFQSYVYNYAVTLFPNADAERIWQTISSESKLAGVCQDMDLDKAVVMDIGRQWGTTFTAFVGGMGKELGYGKLTHWLNGVIAPHIVDMLSEQGSNASPPDIKPDIHALEAARSEHRRESRSSKAESESNMHRAESLRNPVPSTSSQSDAAAAGLAGSSSELPTETKKLEKYKARAEKALEKQRLAEEMRDATLASLTKKVEKYKGRSQRAAEEAEQLRAQLGEYAVYQQNGSDGEQAMTQDNLQHGQSLKRKRDGEEPDSGTHLKNLNWQSSYSPVARAEFMQTLRSQGHFRQGRPMSTYNIDTGKTVPMYEEMTIDVQPILPPSYPPPLPALHESSLFEVLTHRSLNPPLNVMQDPEGFPSFDNERLEFLGDAVLEVHTTEAIFVQHPRLRPGGMVNLRNRLVNGQILSYFSDLYGLPSVLRMPSQVRNQDSHPLHPLSSMKNRADVFEAYIGAVFRDREPGVSRKWLVQLLEPFVKSYLTVVQKEYEDRNRVEVQGHWATAVAKVFGTDVLEWSYGETDRNLDGIASWYANLHIDKQKIATAHGSSKKNTRFTIAAMIAEYLGIPDAAGNMVPDGFTRNLKDCHLNTAVLDSVFNTDVFPNKKDVM
ncbi:hypothetical protein E3P99_03650 [Wallemia hederae]|uniref:RNase III domain-containing protein n=1 Tax=Wallemia hederae TaxID=1540922 RepID=A0A4V4LSL3_9BASI|nr:hypothetical protein E3P99_03650 [Wallemia hederae]